MEDLEKKTSQVSASENPKDESEVVAFDQRRCTDPICVPLYFASIVGFFVVTFMGAGYSNPVQLTKPRDYRGDYCGIGVQWGDGRDLSGYGNIIWMLNTTHATDRIAKELVCSSASGSALETIQGNGHITAAEMDTYLCACCKIPCDSCPGVLGLEDLSSPAALMSTIGSKMGELTNPLNAASLLSPNGPTGGQFSNFLSELNLFVSSCVTGCDVATHNGSDMREYTFSPTFDASWKRAWDILAAHGPPQIKDAIANSFTFKALPTSKCPYDPEYCIPFPGLTFTESVPSVCTFQIAEGVLSALGSSVLDGAEVAEATDAVGNTFGSLLGNVLDSVDALAIVCVMSFVFAFTFAIMLRFLIGICVYLAIFFVFVGLFAIAVGLQVRLMQCNDTSFIDTGKSMGLATASYTQSSLQSIDLALENMTGTGEDYRGYQTLTKTGRTCQRWDSQTPWSHTFTPAANPNDGLVENYCRNPNSAPSIWCFTTDPSTRWEYCRQIGAIPAVSDCPRGLAVSDENVRIILQVFSIGFFVMMIIWFVGICCVLSRIRLVIAVIKVAAQFTSASPSIFLVPIFQGILGTVWTCGWLSSACFLVSQIPIDQVPSDFYATYAEAYGTADVAGKCTSTWPAGGVWRYAGDLTSAADPCSGNMGVTTGITPKCWRCYPPRYTLDWRFAVSFFSFLWSNAMIIAVGQMIIAGAVGAWYFAPKEEKSRGQTLSSVKTTFRYHFGSLAFGTLIIAITQFIRYLMTYLSKQAEAQKNHVMAAIAKCMACCIYCFEKCLQFLTKRAFIQIALKGKPFCTSAKNVMLILLQNAVRFGVLAILGAIIEVLGFVFIVSCTVMCGYFILTLMHPTMTPSPVLLYVAVGYVVSKVFMNVFSIAADTLIQCFIMSEEMGLFEIVPPALQKVLTMPEPEVEKRSSKRSSQGSLDKE